MADSLRLTVLTPSAALLDVSAVDWVQVRLADGGSVGIYPGHAPLLAETQAAALRYAVDGQERRTEGLAAGILRVTAGRVIILTVGPLSDTAAASSGSSAALQDAAWQFDRLADTLVTALRAEPDTGRGWDDAEET